MVSYVSLRVQDYVKFYGLSFEGKPPPTKEEIEKRIGEESQKLLEKASSSRPDPKELIGQLQGNLREKAGLERKFDPKIDFEHE